MKQLRRALLVAAAVATVMIPALSATAAPSSAPALPAPVSRTVVTPASAVGYQPIGSFSYSLGGATISVPSGCMLGHTIKGSSTWIDQEYAYLSCVGPAGLLKRFCNIQYAWVAERTDGSTWEVEHSPIINGCFTGFGVPLAYYPDYQLGPSTRHGSRWTLPGKQCVVFKVNGIGRATQCHYITV